MRDSSCRRTRARTGSSPASAKLGRRESIACALVIALATSACFAQVAIPKPSGAALPIAPGNFPHRTFDAVLAAVVDEHGRVDYRALKSEREELERYLVALASTSPHKDPEAFPAREDQLAYWINAYNAAVLFGVTERPGLRSVNERVKNFFYFTQYSFGDEQLSLYKLENEIIRVELPDARVRFALNWGADGCAALPAEAFTPEKLDAQLERVAAAFCANPRRVRFEKNNVEMSQIFEWYEDDFKAEGGAIEFCRKHGREELPEHGEISYIPFDWDLNAQPGLSVP